MVTGRDQSTDKPIHDSQALPEELQIIHHSFHDGSPGALGMWTPRNEPLYGSNGDPLWQEHPKFGSKADVVALPLTQVDSRIALYPHDILAHRDVSIGPADHVSVVGFPFGIAVTGVFPIYATGFMASDPVFDYMGLPVMLIDCRSRKGQSGSPVVAYRNSGMIAKDDGRMYSARTGFCRFLGVYSGRINPESDIGMVWKSSAIQEIVEVESTRNETGK